MQPNSNMYEVKRVCHIQKRLLSYSHFLSYFSLMKFLTDFSLMKFLTDLMCTISKLSYRIS